MGKLRLPVQNLRTHGQTSLPMPPENELKSQVWNHPVMAARGIGASFQPDAKSGPAREGTRHQSGQDFGGKRNQRLDRKPRRRIRGKHR